MSPPIPSETIEYERFVDGLREQNTALLNVAIKLCALEEYIEDFGRLSGGPMHEKYGDCAIDGYENVARRYRLLAKQAKTAIATTYPNKATVVPAKPIAIEIKGGLVQDVSGIPAGYKLRIEDYDVQDPGDDSWDAEKECAVTVYEGAAV